MQLVALDAADLEAHLGRADGADVAAGAAADDDEVVVLGVCHGWGLPEGWGLDVPEGRVRVGRVERIAGFRHPSREFP
jgi:hypothetical protein